MEMKENSLKYLMIDGHQKTWTKKGKKQKEIEWNILKLTKEGPWNNKKEKPNHISKDKILSLKQTKTQTDNSEKKIFGLGSNSKIDMKKKLRPKTSCTSKRLEDEGVRKLKIKREKECEKPSPLLYGDGEESDFRAWEVDSNDLSLI